MVAWEYALCAAGGTSPRVFTLSAESIFELQQADVPDEALRYVVGTHALRRLTLNGQPALPSAGGRLRREHGQAPGCSAD